MSKYHDVVYGNYKKTDYSEKLINFIFEDWPNKDFRVLEVGCGTGECLRALEKRFNQVEGIDNEIDLNKDKLPYFDESFDIVFTKSVIEHISNTEHFLQEIYRVLKPGGIVVILTPAWEYNYKDFYNDFTHIKPFHRKGLQDALKMTYLRDVYSGYFYHLPWTWKKPDWVIMPVIYFLKLFSRWKWKDKEETKHRVNIRFAQEVQLMAWGYK